MTRRPSASVRSRAAYSARALLCRSRRRSCAARPAEKAVGDAVLAGTLNRAGSAFITPTAVGDATALQRTIAVLQRAQTVRTPEQVRLERAASRLTALLVLLAIGVGAVWLFWRQPGDLARALTCTCAVLAATCPGAAGQAAGVAALAGIGCAAERGKLAAPALPFAALCRLADYVLVEADGSKRLPAKAHETWEPVLPPERTRTICVLGATAFGQPIRQAAHRPAIYARLAGAPWSAVITPEMAARVICAEGLCDIIYVNQVDDPEVSPPWAEAFVRASSVPVVAGSLQARRWRRLS